MMLLLVRSIILGLAAASLAPSRSAFDIGNGLVPGPQAVGFIVRTATDNSRRGAKGPARFQVACWYPAAASRSGRSHMTVADYLALSGADDPASPATDAVAEYRALLVEKGVSGERASAWFSTTAKAARDVPVAAGLWPLVLIAQGNGQSAYHQALLSELIASDGFVVCTAPSPTRLLGAMKSVADILPYATAQARLLDEAARVARGSLRVGRGMPAVVGHSFGARAALIYAERRGARALVSLDGGIGFSQGREWIDGRERDLLMARFRTPLMHIYETDEPAAAPDFTLIESLARSPRLLVRIDGLQHTDFTSVGFASVSVPDLFGAGRADLPDKLAAMAAYTRSFLKAELQQDAAARAFIAASTQGNRALWLSVRRLPSGKR